eukprot:g30696.t1
MASAGQLLPRTEVRYFRRPHGGFLCLADADLAEWPGEALATSTNRHLEGTLRRNWWGFAGRKSADAALHEKAGPELLAECRAQASSLKFGEVVVTKAPNLKARYVLHTVSPDVAKNEQKAEWFDIYKRFEAEAELTMQNALFLWGLVQAKTFQEEFVEEAQQSAVLDDFLSLTDYPGFVKRMFREIQHQQKREQEFIYGWLIVGDGYGCFQNRLQTERNALLVERRALVGREVHATTSQTLKHQIELQRYREEVGMD